MQVRVLSRTFSQGNNSGKTSKYIFIEGLKLVKLCALTMGKKLEELDLKDIADKLEAIVS